MAGRWVVCAWRGARLVPVDSGAVGLEHLPLALEELLEQRGGREAVRAHVRSDRRVARPAVVVHFIEAQVEQPRRRECRRDVAERVSEHRVHERRRRVELTARRLRAAVGVVGLRSRTRVVARSVWVRCLRGARAWLRDMGMGMQGMGTRGWL
eukprot:5067384-Prymnesium_polylepis.1